MTRIPIIWALAAALVVAFAAACGGDDEPSGSGDGASPPLIAATSVPTRSPQNVAAAAEVAPFIQGFQNVSTLKAAVELEAPNQPSEQGVLEMVVPDRIRLAVGSFEVVVIGQDSYVKTEATWVKQTAASGIAAAVTPGVIATYLQDMQNAGIVKGSTATVEGKTCQLYSANLGELTIEACFADNLPLRVVTATGGSKTTVVFTEFNGNVQIQPPV